MSTPPRTPRKGTDPAESDGKTQELWREDDAPNHTLLSTAEVLNSISECLFVFDGGWRYTYVNTRGLAMARRRGEELIGSSLWEIFPELTGTDLERRFRHAMDHGVPVVFEYHYEPYGIWARFRLSPIPGGLMVFATDITGRKQAGEALREARENLEKRVRERTADLESANTQLQVEIGERRRSEAALRESEAKYRTLVETALDMVLIHDTKKILYINPAGVHLLGASHPDEILGRRFLEIVHPDFRDRVRKNVAQDLLGDSSPTTQLQILRLDGTPFWAEGKGVMTHIGGSPVIQVIVRDITERKRAEEALRQNREDLDRAQEIGQIGSWRLDVDRNVLTWSDETYRIFGVPAGTPLTYETFLACVHPDDRKYVDGRWRAGLGGEPYDIEHRIVVDGEVKWVREKAYLEIDDTGRLLGGFGIAQDITERKQAEVAFRRHTEDLARLHRKLQDANREANLYLDILTHDMGNTENVSNLYADLLIDSLQGTGEDADYAKKLQRSVQKSIEILKTVTTIRRIHRTTSGLRPVDLDTVIRDVIADFPGSTILCDGADSSVMADDLLSLVFDNLVGNAVKFGGSGVTVTVRAQDRDGEVLVSVEDTGPGVPDNEKDEIFHRYEQKKRGVGEGLGLFLVQILVERYGGRVWVDDRVPGRPEAGAAFRFTLRKAA
ncbi:PAS domain S-box protein [Methanoculleus sp. FWC-SCC1]|uniref:histidine kinase n=1 Tax=Methanoculleus frigidifontis TaxID=2584085 RepID=A0ABT8M8H1_9EURY|nr:PAS domain S-box protein [Methanoculleus sp. FWC-SCC1]MDN7024234.1 PAS domain S-box protein [Methanoculleus sp. FWC-SCC1]